MHSKPTAGGWRPQEGFKNGVLDQQCILKPSAGGWRPQEGFKNGVLDQQRTLNSQPEAGAHRKASKMVSSTSNAL